jgi:hypothetical protein
LLSQNKVKTTSKVDGKSRGKAEGKVMRENESVLLVLSVWDGEIILEKGEILSEKRHMPPSFSSLYTRITAAVSGQTI